MMQKRYFYGRRRTHRMRIGRKQAFERLIPELSIKQSLLEEELLNPIKLFNENIKSVWLEIGFGSGEHLFDHALSRPDVGFIGCEPYIDGIASLCQKIEKNNVKNVRIYIGDAQTILSRLEENVLERLFILFPDPWPKKRHHKRRIISPDTIPLIYKSMIRGGELRVASDEISYIRWILMHMNRSGKFNWRVKNCNDWKVRPSDWPQTRYEMKAISKGKKPIFLIYQAR